MMQAVLAEPKWSARLSPEDYRGLTPLIYGSEGNLVACCTGCNREKGGLAAWAFLATRPEQRGNFLRYAQWVWPRLRRAVEEAV